MKNSIVAVSAIFVILLLATPTQAQETQVEEQSEEGNVIIDVVLPLSLAFIMFSLGVGLTIEDFSLVFREPKAFGI